MAEEERETQIITVHYLSFGGQRLFVHWPIGRILIPNDNPSSCKLIPACSASTVVPNDN
ncbi:hypothetical protein SK128_015933 [Halocaridina rubra]|uniref:Uncharacterized protein n=1 Tax=Halocaridina rubra TaxID=373956 RepID=A0AAN8WMH8_HALRR